MPADPRAHLARWAEDKALATTLQEGPAPAWRRWGLTLRFYAALHLTQAYLSTKGEAFEASDHGQRWRAIRQATELGGRFRDAYKALQTMSGAARYDAGYVARQADYQAAGAHLVTVEAFVLTKLRAQGITLGPPEGREG